MTMPARSATAPPCFHQQIKRTHAAHAPASFHSPSLCLTSQPPPAMQPCYAAQRLLSLLIMFTYSSLRIPSGALPLPLSSLALKPIFLDPSLFLPVSHHREEAFSCKCALAVLACQMWVPAMLCGAHYATAPY
jgi:hypothetical protein